VPDNSSLNLINISGFLMSPYSHTILPFNDDLIPISENGRRGIKDRVIFKDIQKIYRKVINMIYGI